MITYSYIPEHKVIFVTVPGTIEVLLARVDEFDFIDACWQPEISDDIKHIITDLHNRRTA